MEGIKWVFLVLLFPLWGKQTLGALEFFSSCYVFPHVQTQSFSYHTAHNCCGEDADFKWENVKQDQINSLSSMKPNLLYVCIYCFKNKGKTLLPLLYTDYQQNWFENTIFLK